MTNPKGKKPSSRRQQFSGKAKKQQLKEKRERNRERQKNLEDGELVGLWRRRQVQKDEARQEDERERKISDEAKQSEHGSESLINSEGGNLVVGGEVRAVADDEHSEAQPTGARGRASRRRRREGRNLRSVFALESDIEVLRRKQEATQPLQYRFLESPYHDGVFEGPHKLPVPTRPAWTRKMSPQDLEEVERQAFDVWLSNIEAAAKKPRTIAPAPSKATEQDKSATGPALVPVGAAVATSAASDNQHKKKEERQNEQKKKRKSANTESGSSSLAAPALNYFEQNLEVWRELWRTLERSDLVLYLLDARFPLLHFSPSLYRHIREEQGKQVILCLTKTDLVPPAALRLWQKYFEVELGGESPVFLASSARKPRGSGYDTHKAQELRETLLTLVRQCHVWRGAAHGLEGTAGEGARRVPASRILDGLWQKGPAQIERVEEESVDEREAAVGVAKGKTQEQERERHQQRLKEKEDEEGESRQQYHRDKATSRTPEEGEEEGNLEMQESESQVRKEGNEEPPKVTVTHSARPRENYLVLGVVGEPNMGKSSLINSLFCRKVVSHSPSPGHTKHLQTLFLHRNLVLCDSPGLVCPQRFVPREIQVLFGSFPIAQTRELLGPLRYLAERCFPPLDKQYKIEPLSSRLEEAAEEGKEYRWSPFLLAEAFAVQRGFRAKGGRADTFRAANLILRDALNGRKVVLFFLPPFWYPIKAKEQSRLHENQTHHVKIDQADLARERRGVGMEERSAHQNKSKSDGMSIHKDIEEEEMKRLVLEFYHYDGREQEAGERGSAHYIGQAQIDEEDVGGYKSSKDSSSGSEGGTDSDEGTSDDREQDEAEQEENMYVDSEDSGDIDHKKEKRNLARAKSNGSSSTKPAANVLEPPSKGMFGLLLSSSSSSSSASSDEGDEDEDCDDSSDDDNNHDDTDES